MKSCVRLVALVLTLALSLTLIGCHEKGETVMKIGETEISSGLYLAFQLSAYNQMRSDINAQLEEYQTNVSAGTASSPAPYIITEPEDYFTVQYNGMTGEAYILAEAENLAREYALIEQNFAAAKLSFTKTELDNIDTDARNIWNNGTKEIYEPNGVNYETFKKTVLNTYKREKLFYNLYDQGGSSQVSDEDLAKAMGENYILADYMTVTTTDANGADLSEEKIKEIKARMDEYAKTFNDGKKTYAEIYKEEYGQEPTEQFTNDGETKSIYPTTAMCVYKNDTNEQSNAKALFEFLNPEREKDGVKPEQAYVVDGTDKGVYALVIFYDIEKDPFYLEAYRSQILVDLKSDEFNTSITNDAKKLQVTKTGDLDHYSPTNILYDEYVSETQNG